MTLWKVPPAFSPQRVAPMSSPSSGNIFEIQNLRPWARSMEPEPAFSEDSTCDPWAQ